MHRIEKMCAGAQAGGTFFFAPIISYEAMGDSPIRVGRKLKELLSPNGGK
jgi:hypothetical protein